MHVLGSRPVGEGSPGSKVTLKWDPRREKGPRGEQVPKSWGRKVRPEDSRWTGAGPGRSCRPCTGCGNPCRLQSGRGLASLYLKDVALAARVAWTCGREAAERPLAGAGGNWDEDSIAASLDKLVSLSQMWPIQLGGP